MRLPARQIVGYGLNVAAIAAFTVLLGFALFKLAQIESGMRIDASENMLWVVSQARTEALRLDAAVAHKAASIDQNEPVVLRFDMLLSRLALLSEGPQADLFARLGFSDEYAPLAEELRALEPLVIVLEPGDSDAAETIAQTVGPLSDLLGRAANAAMVAEWDGLGARLDESRAAIWQVIGSAVGIMLAGGLLSAGLILTLRATRRTERSLRREKQFSELLVGSSGEGIIAIDRQQRCTVWNPAMQQVISILSYQATGQRLSEISGLFAVESVQRAIAESLAGESVHCLDQIFFPGNTEETRYLDLLFSPLRNGADVVGAIIFVRDVTERHAAERELVRHRDRLEELVGERTRDLREAQTRLIAAMDELEAALERERGVSEFYRGFASMVSHQFRTPLAIIDSNVQRLVRRGDKVTSEEIAQRASRIRTGITRLTRLVEATLDAARLDTGQVEVKLAPCDLAVLARSACERQNEMTPEREFVFQADASGAIARALCDPALVEHILVNLLSNAVKYSPSDSPIGVHIGVRDGAAFCAVSDRGVGVPEDEVSRLFERFFRASTASGVTGTGIGLNLSRSLAHLQNGNVAVETRQNEGSTFTLSLPLAEIDAIPQAAE